MFIFHRLGIRAMLSSYDIHQDCTPELLQDICKESGINHLVLLKASEVDHVRVRVFKPSNPLPLDIKEELVCCYHSVSIEFQNY